jgi:hypothetical protein
VKVDIQTAPTIKPVEERNFNSQGARLPPGSLLRFDISPIAILIEIDERLSADGNKEVPP